MYHRKAKIPEKTANKLITLIHRFAPEFDGADLNWKFYLKIGRRWQYFHTTEYQGIHFFSGDDLDIFSIGELTDEPDHPVDEDINKLALKWITALEEIYTQVKQSPALYHKNLTRTLPPKFRLGVIARSFVRDLIPGYMRFDKGLTKTEMNKMVKYLKEHTFLGQSIPKMTARLYFDYCKVAYAANQKTLSRKPLAKTTGRELYKCYADGRDAGLSKLPLDSKKAFQEWYESNNRAGAHPWEIYRGGSYTQINLSVKEHYTPGRWSISLDASSSTRLVETCRIALAFKKAGLPFKLSGSDSYLKRLLAEDYIGVVPDSYGITYADQSFPEEFNVYDCIHFYWLKDETKGNPAFPMSTVKNLITWMPIRPLRLQK